MKKGYLSQYFEGVAAKELSAVEVDTLSSNQHEFNGISSLKDFLGEPCGKKRYPAKFLYLTDYEDDPVVEDGFLTWYDARQKARIERGVKRWEYRLYFPTNRASQYAETGDILIIAKCRDDTLLAIVAESGTTIAQQVLWLFGFTDLSHPGFAIREELETEQDRIEFTSRFILESIGISVETTEDTWLDAMLEKFGGIFPPTKKFSEYARSTLPDIHAEDGHDDALMAWIEREEILFRTLEKYIVGKRLAKGFHDSIEDFLSFSLSVQNRRKSRAGLALENHIELLFQECGIRYARTPITENKAKPDFIFPGKDEYHNPKFKAENLTMLGVKTSCKDRWRQVLAEANRIEKKHLLTLEAAISKNQTAEMKANALQLVVPQKLHKTYSKEQQFWLMDVCEFTHFVLGKQKKL